MSAKYDVIVIGAGSAGCIAALAAARLGASVALIEKEGYVGGTPVSVGISSLAPFHYRDRQVVTGIPQEFVDRLVEAGASLGHMKVENEYGTGSYVCLFDREKYKYVMLRMLLDNKIVLFLHSTFNGAVLCNNQIINIQLTTFEERIELYGKVFIDCSGDAVVAHRAGCPTVIGREADGKVQPATLMFEMSNVDVFALWEYIQKHSGELEWFSKIIPSTQPCSLFNPIYFVAQGFKQKLKKSCRKFDRLGRETVLLFTGLWRGVVSFNSTRVHLSNPVSVSDLTRAEIEAREQIEILAEWIRSALPGFEESYVSWVGARIGVRESRRILGHYILTAEDILSSRTFSDSIAKGFFPIDVHDPDGKGGYGPGAGLWIPLQNTYDIPYRILIPQKVDNLLVAGRCVSATHEALGSLRVAPCCMALGQAAGVAAALSAQLEVSVANVPLKLLHGALERVGQTY